MLVPPSPHQILLDVARSHIVILTGKVPIDVAVEDTAWLCAFTYYSRRSMASCKTLCFGGVGGDTVGRLCIRRPFVWQSLWSVVTTAVLRRQARISEDPDNAPALRDPMSVFCYRVSWPYDMGIDDELHGVLHIDRPNEIPITWKKPSQPKPPGGDAPAPSQEGGDVDDAQLLHMVYMAEAVGDDGEAENEPDATLDPEAEHEFFLDEEAANHDEDGVDLASDVEVVGESDWDEELTIQEALAAQQNIRRRIVAHIEQRRGAIEAARRLAQAVAADTLERRQISLMEDPFRGVLFVEWTDPARRMAREIILDNLNRIVAVPEYTLGDPTSYAACPPPHIVNCGVTKRRQGGRTEETKKLRVDMPEWTITLLRWHQARIHPGPLDGSSEAHKHLSCLYCTESGHRLRADTDIYRCVSCACAMHLWCADLARGDDHDEWFNAQHQCAVCRYMGVLA